MVDAIRLVNPRTGHVRGQTAASLKLAERVVADAVGSFEVWRRWTPAGRSNRMHDFVAELARRTPELVAAEMAGTGKPEAEAVGEVVASLDVLRFYAGAARQLDGVAAGSYLERHQSWVRQEPLGVVVAILPWNYPLMMAAWRLGPALAAGNTVVLKPAPSTPDSAWVVDQAARQTLGMGVVRVVTGDAEVGQYLAAHDDVEMVCFTVSPEAGDAVQRAAVGKRLSLELGGNCPAIVCPDAPYETCDRLARAVTLNAGQSCAAPSRVIVVGDSADRRNFSALLWERLLRYHAGRDFGPLNNQDQLDRVTGLVQGVDPSVDQVYTGSITTDPDADEDDGFWHEPVLIDGPPDDDPVVTRETFGPVLTVQNMHTLEGAVDLANSLPYALASSVWTCRLDAALRASEGLRGGEVWVNCALQQTPELPHGGVGRSGHGTDMSRFALAEYQRVKAVTVALG